MSPDCSLPGGPGDAGAPTRLRVATVSLAGCFGCHMSLLDIDERLFELAPHLELDRSPLTDIKSVGPCDIGLVEGGVCNAENVDVLRAFREQCRMLVAVGACAINGGLPAQRNAHPLGLLLSEVYVSRPGLCGHSAVPVDPELPLLLDKVYPIHEVVRVDFSLPGCPPSAEAFWVLLQAVVQGRKPELGWAHLHYD